MVREKISRNLDERIILYEQKDIELLTEKRKIASKIMEALKKAGADPLLHGSVARGDVHEKSDVDIAVLNMTPSYIIEIALDRFGLKQFERKIVQATPMSTPKGYITLDPEGLIVVSFPLARLQSREVEFYKFGGSISLEELQEGKRVLGVNKRLELIKPIEHGYLVSSILGREGEVASLLGISLETVLERMRVLSRRDKIGRTGVYLSELVSTGESFEQKLKEIAERDPAVRRALRGR